MKTSLLCVLASFAVVACGPEQGPTGSEGPRGPPGKDGVGLITTISCSGTMPFNSTMSASIIYNAYKFADGSLMTTCDVDISSVSGTGVYLWKATQQGAKDASCLARLDADASPTRGFFTFNINDQALTNPIIISFYRDAGSPYDGLSWTGVCTKFQ